MFLFLHLKMFVVGVRYHTRVRVYILCICIYIPYLRDSFFVCFWKISVIKLRTPSRFLTSVEQGLCWDHDERSLSCQDKLSPGKNIRAAPHTIPWVPPLSLGIISDFRVTQISLARSPLGNPSWHWICHLHVSWMCGHIVGQDQPAANQEIPAQARNCSQKGLGCSYIVLGTRVSSQNGNPGWHQGQRAAVTLTLLPLPGHPACAGSICSWWASGQAQTWVFLAA